MNWVKYSHTYLVRLNTEIYNSLFTSTEIRAHLFLNAFGKISLNHLSCQNRFCHGFLTSLSCVIHTLNRNSFAQLPVNHAKIWSKFCYPKVNVWSFAYKISHCVYISHCTNKLRHATKFFPPVIQMIQSLVCPVNKTVLFPLFE